MSPEAPGGRLGWVRRHPTTVALITYLVAACIFFSPGLLPGHTLSAADYLFSAAPWHAFAPAGLLHWGRHSSTVGSNPQLVDGITVFEPFLAYTRSVLPHIPLWDPYIMGGTPYLADMQSAIFSPFSLPAYLLPFWWSLGVIAVMKVVVAAMGVFLLGRRIGMRPGGAFLAGLVFAFGFFMIAWIPWPLTNVFPLIPWTLLATEAVVRRPGPLSMSGLAFVTALQLFGGHPESSMQLLFATVAWFLLRLCQTEGGLVAAVSAARRARSSVLSALARKSWRPAVTFAAGLVLGAALAAVVILPFLELLHHSNDLTLRPRGAVHVEPKYFFAALIPDYFPGSFAIETAFYTGALPLLLAVISLARPSVTRVALAVAGLASLLIVLGLPPLFSLAAHTPGLDLTFLSRLTIFFLLAIALLAGFGLDDVLAAGLERRQLLAGGGAAVLLFVLPIVLVVATGATSLRYLGRAASIAFLFARAPLPGAPHVDPVVRLAGLLVWVVVITAAAALLFLRVSRRLGKATFLALAVLLVAGDLFQAGMGYNPGIPQSHADLPATGAIRYLAREDPARFVAVTVYDGVNPLPPDVGMRYGLYDLRGYDLPVITQFATLWRRYMAPPNPLLPVDTPSLPLGVYDQLSPKTVRILSLFGVRDVLVQPSARLTNTGFRLVYSGRDARVYENLSALPRAFLVGGDDVVKHGSDELSTIVSPAFEPGREVVTEQRLGRLADGPLRGPRGSARIVAYRAEKVTIAVRAGAASELVLSDSYFPGWTATVDGKPVPIHRVDYLLRGVAVPAGASEVVFSYQPTSFAQGWVTSLAAAAVLLLATLVGWRRRRRSDGPHDGRAKSSRGKAPDGSPALG